MRGGASRPSRCRAGIRSRRPWRRCTPTAARRRRAPAARRRPARRGPTTRTRPRRRTRRRRPPTPARATPPSPIALSQPARTSVPTRRAAGGKALADAGDAHFLAGRRRGGDGEQVAGQTADRRAALLRRSLDRRPPRRRQHRRQREDGEQHERRVNRRQQRHRHAEPQDPSAGGEQRHVHVIEHEHLIAQHRQPVEVIRPLLVRDRRSRRLQSCDVRFERDRHLVAEPPLHARADRAEEPRGGCRHAEADRRDPHQRRASPASTPSPSSLSHSASSASGSAASSDSTNAADHQPRLVLIAELAQPPHRRRAPAADRLDLRIEVLSAISRGRHTPSLPRPRSR